MACPFVQDEKIKNKFKMKMNHINKMKYPNCVESDREYNFYLCYIFHARNWIFLLFSEQIPHRLAHHSDCFFLSAPLLLLETFQLFLLLLLNRLSDPKDLFYLFWKYHDFISFRTVTKRKGEKWSICRYTSSD